MNPTLPLCLSLLGVSLAVARQAEAPAPSGRARPTETLPPINAAPQAQQAVPTDDLEGPDATAMAADVNEAAEPGQTNAPTEAADEARSDRSGGGYRRPDGRQSRQNRFARERQRARLARDNLGSGTDSGTNGPGRLDYAAFSVIAELNIFDPNRAPSGPKPVQAPTAEYFTLVGTAHLDTGPYAGTYAYFTGSDSKYEKKLKVSDSIAGYKIVKIAADSVELARAATNAAAESLNPASTNNASGNRLLAATNAVAGPVKPPSATNDIELRMRMQMRREENGPWELSAAPSSSAASSSLTPVASSGSSAASGAVAAGGESDALKRMMLRRAQEESPK